LQPLAWKLDVFVALSDNELAILADMHERSRTFVARRDLVHRG
jgi:hypothetical protein